jgi:hypothetical protein
LRARLALEGDERRRGERGKSRQGKTGHLFLGGFRFLPLFLWLLGGWTVLPLPLSAAGEVILGQDGVTNIRTGGERVTHDMRLLACCHASMHGLHAGRTGSS